MRQPHCPRCCAGIKGPGACGTCGFEIPAEWLNEVPLGIAMTGARTAGKSVLIAVMMQQFRYFLEQRHQTFLEPLGDTADRFQRDYLDPLYRHQSMLRPTARKEQAPIIPLMWSFRYGPQRYCLALYDAAGEDFETASPGDPHFAYLGRVDLLASIVDPTKVEDFKPVLDGTVAIPADSGNDLVVMRRVLQARRAHLSDLSPQQLLAIVISKFDVVQGLSALPAMPWRSIMARPGAAMQRDPSFVSLQADRTEADLLDCELRSLLHVMNAQLLLAAAKDTGMVTRLFAVSALGLAPSSNAVHQGGISPFRVIEIIKTALAIKETRA